MSGQERLKRNRLTNKYNRLLHSSSSGRSRSPSPPRDSQTSSTSVRPQRPDPTSNPLSLYPSIVIDPAGDEDPGRMADLTSAEFQGVKTTLRLVERATDVFPPIKSTVGGLLGVIDIVEVRDFQLSVVFVMVLTVPRQPLRTNKIAKVWSRS